MWYVVFERVQSVYGVASRQCVFEKNNSLSNIIQLTLEYHYEILNSNTNARTQVQEEVARESLSPSPTEMTSGPLRSFFYMNPPLFNPRDFEEEGFDAES